ncbi:MAG TPA: DNA alkylation repair protein [Anaerolineales bacterium]
MPAINLARLKTQAARLSEKFSDPEAFVCDLNELLDYYTNRTIRATQIARRLSLPTYSTPAPVLRQIQAELVPLAGSHPIEALALADALWKAGSLETRLLAAYLLGSIPLAQAIPALTRLPDWLAQSTDKEIRKALLTDAFARLRRENPEALFILLEDWLKSPRFSLQLLGLQALIPMLTDPHFENLPAVFRILKPAVRSAGPVTQLELQACLATLGQVSLTETLAFLREIIGDNPPPLMLRTFRRLLAGLSPELQSGLREMLRKL